MTKYDKSKGQDTKLCIECEHNYVKKKQRKNGNIRMHSFSKHLLNICHILDIMFDAGDLVVIKTHCQDFPGGAVVKNLPAGLPWWRSG